jgi:hypothetical protein
MIIVTLQNQKGSIGKTTFAVHIAAAYAMPSWRSSGHESGGQKAQREQQQH